MPGREHEHAVRAAAFAWLREQQRSAGGEVLARDLLEEGFVYDGVRVPIVGPKGIFKPALLAHPLSICTKAPKRGVPAPYEDRFTDSDLLEYKYRGTNPKHRDNVGLRSAMQHRLPLVYVRGIEPGWYLPVFPVWIVADEPMALSFHVSLDDAGASTSPLLAGERAAPERRYRSAEVLQRVHQAAFRFQVMDAYGGSCSICRIKHDALLDAAHIVPDGAPRGEPVVPNGLLLCKIHHAALDANLMGIRPDGIIEVRADVLAENDGPMLRFGIQSAHGLPLIQPRARIDRPDPTRLEWRYETLFRKAG